MAAIVFVGVLSALLVIPQIRTVAGGVLASSAVIGLVIGFASQRTIGNVVAGLLIAVSQPLRLGDEVEVEGTQGVVEEIGLTYTWIRTRDNDRLVVPNERLASEPIRNSTIRSAETYAEATVEVPSANLRATVKALEGDGDEVYVTALTADKATVARPQARPGRRHRRPRVERSADRARRAARGDELVSRRRSARRPRLHPGAPRAEAEARRAGAPPASRRRDRRDVADRASGSRSRRSGSAPARR